jgi:hypothetical protein
MLVLTVGHLLNVNWSIESRGTRLVHKSAGSVKRHYFRLEHFDVTRGVLKDD